MDIHIRSLRDRQQYHDAGGVAEKLGISSASWPLFGVVWASSEVLAHLLFDYHIGGRRVLEVGCGMALASLVLNHRMADITATDCHPEVEGFLEKNVGLNSGRRIPFVRTGWDDRESALGRYDLLVGSDLLYEEDQTDLLARFIDRHARARCEVIVVDPGRSYHGRFTKRMVEFGYSHSYSKPDHTDYLAEPFRGRILNYTR